MSQDVFPALPGISWDVEKEPMFSTRVLRAVTGREQRAAFMAFPLWTFRMKYNLLRETDANVEMKTLAGFFLERKGSFDSFLYTDPNDYTVTDQNFGTGNDTEDEFQLVRTFGGGGFSITEPTQNINGTPTIKDNGVTVDPNDYTISSTGLVTFDTPPVGGHVLTWTGSYYFRVRFEEDVAAFNEFMSRLWDLREMSFVGSPGNKV